MATGSLLDRVEDAAHDDFNASHLPWRIDVDGPGSAVTSRIRMGGSWFVNCRVGRMTGRRGLRDIQETPGDFIAVLLVDRGTEIFTQNDVETVVTAGTAALWDSVRPSACFSAATLVKRTMFFPRDVLVPRLRDVESTMTRTLPDSADLRLLSSWLQVAHRHTDDAEAAATAGMLAVDLVHAAVARARGESAESGDVLLLRVKSYLGEHLHDSDLRLDDVARACASRCATCTSCSRARARRPRSTCAGAGSSAPTACSPPPACRSRRWRTAAGSPARRRSAAPSAPISGSRRARARNRSAADVHTTRSDVHTATSAAVVSPPP